jgi:hypothetical protein
MQEKDGGISVAGVCAHECGHIYQLKHGIMTDEIGISVLELHADFIAGYYIGRRSGYTSDQVKTFSASIYKLGDYQYSDPAHHGSPGQRSAAVERGYRVATEGSNINDASNIGLSYAKSLQ